MKHFSFFLAVFCYVYLHLLLFTLTIMWFGQNTRTAALALSNQTDNLTLLHFKDSISNDPNGVLDSWNSSSHFCNCHGITCGRKHQRVTELNLQGYELRGSISPHIGNISFLRTLNLAKNNFFGNIPNELGRLFRLQQLFLTNNSLSAYIPINLTYCSNLEGLHLGGNNLIGKIPIEITSLQNLQDLVLRNNKLTGGVPSFIGNLSSLIFLAVGYNNLQGNIPQEICRLKNLTELDIFLNNLTSTFPSCLYNMSSLTVISATENQFNGSLPPNMFTTLPNLQILEISGNQIEGTVGYVPPEYGMGSEVSTRGDIEVAYRGREYGDRACKVLGFS
ncbi:non-specific serine/threonine protein kinase [Trifolium repens]|nr:non-specific serine/threonine protein kinase [Trifolium repens]